VCRSTFDPAVVVEVAHGEAARGVAARERGAAVGRDEALSLSVNGITIREPCLRAC
jgi:hypothetical protein